MAQTALARRDVCQFCDMRMENDNHFCRFPVKFANPVVWHNMTIY